MRPLLPLGLVLLTLVLPLRAQSNPADFADRPFDDSWKFLRGQAASGEAPGFDDSSWRTVNLPHDWSIEDLPSRDQDPLFAVVPLVPGSWLFSPGDDPARSTIGFVDSGWKQVTLPEPWEKEGLTQPNAFAWYRRHFTIPASAAGKTVFIDLGLIHDQDWTYVDGNKVHESGKDYWSNASIKGREIALSGANAQPGDHVIAVRIKGCTKYSGFVGTLAPPAGPSPCDPGRSAGNISTGYVVGGTGWYRKHFTLPPGDADKQIRVVFDGSYMETAVWLNGTPLGKNDYGYSPFAFDLKPALKPAGQDNVLAVRVDNLGANSRWYSGSGIFRPLHLEVAGATRMALWGLAITTPQVTSDQATVQASVQLDAASVPPGTSLQLHLFDPVGHAVGQATATPVTTANGSVASFNLPVSQPKLWSPDAPLLYRAEVTCLVDGNVTDQRTSSFGIRTLAWNSRQGFLLNGNSIKLKGGCVHHDFGSLGSASFPEAEERRVRILKAAGYNAIRCSHNMPSTAFLDACDRQGMLVIDEAFDMWNIPKNDNDYSRFFKADSAKDVAAMVHRDRNHPCIVMWSIGNEIPERFDPPGIATAKSLADEIRSIDPSRPVTAAFNNVSAAGDPFFSHLDICGYNYSPLSFAPDHQRDPNRVMFTTESYPKDSFTYWSYVERNPYVIGDFIWTAWDYRGESGIGHTVPAGGKSTYLLGWPYNNAFCGDFDSCGFVKPQGLYRQVMWDARKVAIAVNDLPPGQKSTPDLWGWRDEAPSWTWPGTEGKLRTVRVYAKGDRVKLLLNGHAVGSAAIDPQYTATFSVPYQPGQLTAQVFAHGQQTAQTSLQTAGDPATLKLTPEEKTMPAKLESVSFITLQALDAQNEINPDAHDPVQVTVTGPAQVAGFGNGDPTNTGSVQTQQQSLWHGQALLILRSTGAAGPIQVVAREVGLPDATTTITAQ